MCCLAVINFVALACIVFIFQITIHCCDCIFYWHTVLLMRHCVDPSNVHNISISHSQAMPHHSVFISKHEHQPAKNGIERGNGIKETHTQKIQKKANNQSWWKSQDQIKQKREIEWEHNIRNVVWFCRWIVDIIFVFRLLTKRIMEMRKNTNKPNSNETRWKRKKRMRMCQFCADH